MQVLPTAFVARHDEEKDVAALWGEVWEEATSGGAAALRLYITDIVPLVTSGAAVIASNSDVSPERMWKLSCTGVSGGDSRRPRQAALESPECMDRRCHRAKLTSMLCGVPLMLTPVSSPEP